MSFLAVGPGANVPNDINVVIEIPACSTPVKYEMDKETGILHVDRFLDTAMHYPCNYGYVPGSLSEDGDPVDVLVLTPFPLIHGCLIRVRPIGMLKMVDESGVDAKILAVPMDKLSVQYRHIKTPEDISPHLLATIAHFFGHYKDLEQGKWSRIEGWVGVEEARNEIIQSVARYQEKV